MSIAQHFVAGEGEAHPSITDAAALAAFSCDTTNLTWIIFRAAHRASHVAELPARARALFAALARTVDAKKPFAAIYAGRELLTGRALQSTRTFYRSLTDLEAAGLITRTSQLRYVEIGKFGRTYIHLTHTAAELLGLVEPTVAQTPQSPQQAQADEAEATHATGRDSLADAPDDSLAQPDASLAHGAIYGDLPPPAFQKRQPGQLPADLQRLRALGFSDFLIFKKMREAREQGKRLSDVVEVTWDFLKQATRPICYLNALLGSKTDFGFQLRKRNAEKTAARVAAQEQQDADALTARVAGQSFIDADGTRKLVVDTDGLSLCIQSVEEGVVRREVGQWQVRFAKALQAGQIRLATEADLEAFAQARRRASAPAQTTATPAWVKTATAESTLTLLRDNLRQFSPALSG